MASSRRFSARVLTAWHRFTGRVCYLTGRLRSARRHFERVLDLVGDDFVAHIYLGRIAYARGDFEAWHRRFELAQRAAPRRYSHHHAASSAHDSGIANAPGSGLAELIDQEGRPLDGDLRSQLDEWELELPPFDDFASEEEREKFENLGPIDFDEIYSVDLDDLARRLVS